MNARRYLLLLSIQLLVLASALRAQPMPSYARHFRYVLDIPGGYVNDHTLIHARNEWHLFFIQGIASKEFWHRDGNEVTIGHATSPDLINWTVKKPALGVGPAGALDAGHVFAPGVIERDGVFYMIYTGVEKTFFAGQHLFMATSTDLENWTRHSPDPIFSPDTSWAAYFPAGFEGGRGGPVAARDPHIVRDATHGYICYYAAAIRVDTTLPRYEREFTCIAAATSPDLINWTDRGPVLTRRTAGYDAYRYANPESPCVVKRFDMYYLFWKGGAGTRYVISKNPLDFNDRDQYFLATSHASKVFTRRDQWYITSCSRDVDDITHSLSDRERGLFLGSIMWHGNHPVVTPLVEEGKGTR